MTGIQINHAPHKGGGPAVTSLLGGHVQAMWNPPASFQQYVPTGKIKILAVATPKRVDGVDAPTLTESGYPGLDSAIWLGLFMPAGTPKPIVTKFNAAVHDLLTKDKSVIDAYKALGLVISGGTPEDLGTLLSQEIVRWGKVIKDSGAKLD
jgi:tripartite-type tricarboxylate transporter receptor subunit TctC